MQRRPRSALSRRRRDRRRPSRTTSASSRPARSRRGSTRTSLFNPRSGGGVAPFTTSASGITARRSRSTSCLAPASTRTVSCTGRFPGSWTEGSIDPRASTSRRSASPGKSAAATWRSRRSFTRAVTRRTSAISSCPRRASRKSSRQRRWRTPRRNRCSWTAWSPMSTGACATRETVRVARCRASFSTRPSRAGRSSWRTASASSSSFHTSSAPSTSCPRASSRPRTSSPARGRSSVTCCSSARAPARRSRFPTSSRARARLIITATCSRRWRSSRRARSSRGATDTCSTIHASDPNLAEHYWKPGNSRTFLSLVEALTGEPFSAKALVGEANRDVRQALDEASRALAYETKLPKPSDPIELDARISIIHGDEIIAQNHAGEPFDALERTFAEWIDRVSEH